MTPINPHHHGGTVVFELPFKSRMSGAELELLRRQLGMTTHVEHKLPADPNSPAVAELDQEASLLLEHAAGEDQWLLQARTWGRPSERTVHAWQVLVTTVIRQLDPTVEVPPPIPVAPYSVRMQRVGHAANTRWAAARRRLVGLP